MTDDSRRVPPADLEAEQALLGAALLQPGTVLHAVERLVSVGDFYRPQHQLIWQAILDVHAEGHADPVTVAGHLQAAGHHGESFTAEALGKLWEINPSIAGCGTYARLIVQQRLRRHLIEIGAEITDLGWVAHPGLDAVDAVDKARQLIAAVDMPAAGAMPLNVTDFLDAVDYTSVNWLIPGFLERQDRMLVTSTEGGGKSVLLTQIAVQAAAGVHPWSLRRMPPVSVLVVDCENGDKRVARRLDDCVSRAPIDFDPDRLRVISRPRGLNLHARADRLWLMDTIRITRAELVVIGPAYRLSRSVAQRGDVGGEQHALEITDALDECRDRYGCSFLMETHAAHGPLGGGTRDLRPFGSSVWMRWPEFGLGLRRKSDDDPDRYQLQHWRGPRDTRLWPTELLKNHGSWPWSAVMPTGTFHHDEHRQSRFRLPAPTNDDQEL